MSLSSFPEDILRQIIHLCDVLSILRLERLSKRIKNIINRCYWARKYRKVFPHLKDISNDIKGPCILMAIMELKTEVIKKYSHQIPEQVYSFHKHGYYRKTKDRIQRREVKLKYIYKTFPEEPFLKDLQMLKKNLWYHRKTHPLFKRDVLIKQISHRYGEHCPDIIAKSGTILIYKSMDENGYLICVKFYVRKTNYWYPGDESWIECKDITRYLTRLRSKYCLSIQEYEELFQGSKEALEWFSNVSQCDQLDTYRKKIAIEQVTKEIGRDQLSLSGALFLATVALFGTPEERKLLPSLP